VEITDDEAEVLMAAWAEYTRSIQRDRATPAGAAPDPESGGAAEPGRPAAPGGAAQSTPGTSALEDSHVAPRRRTLSRRLLYGLGGLAAAIVIVVVVSLAATGNLGTGSGTSTGSSNSMSTAETTTTSVDPGDVVAKVGGYKISRQQLDQRIADFQAQYAGQVPDKNAAPDQYKLFQVAVLDYLVVHHIVAQTAADLGIEVTDEDLQAKMALILDTSFGGDEAKFNSALQEQGLTREQFERIYRESMLFNKVYAEVTKGVTVTDEDVQAYYDQHTSDSYAGKPLADVREEIRSTLLEAKQREYWSDWLGRKKESLGVTYANGWSAPAGTSSTL
jgi:SurA-like N-terminal domain